MKIRSYEQQISPQGEIGGVRATGDDFGAQVGRAEGDMAQAGQQIVQFNEQLAAARDQVWRNQAVSEYQLKQMQALQAAKTDPDFVKKYGADGQQFASSFEQTLDTNKNSLAAAAPSPRSARLLTDELNNVNTNLMGDALAYQAHTGGEYMKMQGDAMIQTDVKTVQSDPSQRGMVLARGTKAIAELPLLSPEKRSELLKDYINQIAEGEKNWNVLHRPEQVLQAIAPDVMANFKPTARVEAAKAYAPVYVAGGAKPDGMVSQGNIDIANRPVVNNADGSISTVRSITIEQDGKAILIPTVSEDGKILSNETAIKQYQTTGKNLGVFANEAAADKYAGDLHNQQATAYAPAPPVTSFSFATNLDPRVAALSPLIKQSSAQYAVDPNFMSALFNQESHGDPKAVNNSDVAVTGHPSTGIAQFQPATAAQYGVTDPTDVNQAIPGSAHFVSDLLKQFGGDYTKVAAAYNYGGKKVTGLIATYGADWQQHLPASTQEYINGIFATAAPMSSAEQSLASIQQKQATAEPSRAPTNPDWFNKLTWQQQFATIHEAEQGVSANQVRDAQTIQLAEQQRKAQQQKKMNEMFNKVGDPNNPLTVADIRTSDLDYQNKEHMLTAINAVNRGEMATDPAVFNTLFQRVHLPTGDHNKLADDDALLPYVGKGLSITDLNVLRNEIRGKNTPDGAALADLKKNFFSMAKSQIDNSIFGVSLDPGGKDKFYQFQQNVISTVDREVRAGADPLELFDPKSSKYLGKLIPLYQRTNQQQAADVAAHLRGATATPAAAIPRQAGETPAAYLQRTKGTQK